jgi:hypothetical protein
MEREPPMPEQKNKKEPGASKQKTVHVERKFNEIRDLLRLEFSFDGKEIVNVYSATPEQMTMLAGMYANVSEVDTAVWPVSERLDFVNALWNFCQSKNFNFPLYIKPLVEPVRKESTSNFSLNLGEDEHR